ncbi:MAG: efflux RND transporter periplasmic adaptor subunit [Blastocatellia bacterium]|nr:MAG: efflux RND transporter periplasmic adaptor subunit [Blastocatellia bacterium]
MRVSYSFLSLIFVPLWATTACSGGEASNASQPAGGGRGGGQGPVPVTVASVVQKSMPIEIRVIGTAEPYSTVAVRAQTTGQLTAVNFTEGDDVQKGQVLFSLDRRPLEAALQQAEANLQRDLAQAANAESQAKRYQDLAERGIATREQLETSRTGAAALSAAVEADRAAVENAKVQLEYATIDAPLSGRTGALMVHEGNLVRANDTTPLVVINQVSPIFVSFAIPESQLPDLKRYMAQGSLRVEASPPNDEGPGSTGRITFVDNTVDPTTGTIRIKGTFTNDNRRLWPGQFVNVTVRLTADPNAIVAPTAAIQTGQQGTYVYIVKPDKSVDLQTVTVARSSGTDSVIQTGLKPGDTVVTDGHLRLVPGSHVSVKGQDSQKVVP